MVRSDRALPAVLAGSFTISRNAMWLGSVILLLAVAHLVAQAGKPGDPRQDGPRQDGPRQHTAKPSKACAVSLDFAGSNDTEVLAAFGTALRQLLKHEDFEQLDCIADAERSGKQMFPGGFWKIHEYYWGLTKLSGHPTQEDWQEQLALAKKWVDAKPNSVTARIVQAQLYVNYAWDARGTDTSETVTDSGWKLFGQRLDTAKEILDKAANLQQKCPEWYFTMQSIALGQGWPPRQALDLFQRAIAAEPGYYYYYRSAAYFLMPQWNGEDGDAARFAAQSADRVGGEAGDILYFQIGAKIVCACNDGEFPHLSWERLQKGYELLEKKYGVALVNLNKLAVMAVKSDDWVTADAAFQRIGDSWDRDSWITQKYFNQMKSSAASMAPAYARTQGILNEAAANLKTPAGAQYQKNIEQAFLPMMRQCSQIASDALQRFEIVVKVGQDGGTEDAWPRQPTAMAQCLLKQLYESHLKKETPFPVPPHPAYWLDLHLDPAMVNASAAN